MGSSRSLDAIERGGLWGLASGSGTSQAFAQQTSLLLESSRACQPKLQHSSGSPRRARSPRAAFLGQALKTWWPLAVGGSFGWKVTEWEGSILESLEQKIRTQFPFVTASVAKMYAS